MTQKNTSADEQVELEIEKLSFGGDGIARKDSLVYFVPWTVPGDRILAKVLEKKKNYIRAEIFRILSPSPARVQPPCEYYGKCGGCNWQHVSYDMQVSQKELIVREQLKKLNLPPEVYFPIIRSPQTWNYRNRIQMRVSDGKFGFYGRKSHELVEIKSCMIAEPSLNSEISQIKNAAKSLPDAEKIEIYLNQKNQPVIRDTSVASDDIGFSQVNSQQNAHLIEKVLEWSGGHIYSEILDLYGGSGNFSFPLLSCFSKTKVICVELSSAAVQRGRQNAAEKGISKKMLSFLLTDVESYLKRIGVKENSLIILDPPRMGCSQIVADILKRSEAQKILYISCNPSSLARDLGILISTGRFAIRKVQPFDMFPQTDHIETLVEISRIP